MTESLLPLFDQAGMRQVDVARVLNLSPATVSRMFDGQRDLTLSEAGRLAEELTARLGRPVSLDDIAGRGRAA